MNVSRFEFRISCDHLGGSLSVSQEPENNVNRDAKSANAGLAIALLGVYGDSVKSYGRHST